MSALDISFLILLATSCPYAWLRGGWEGKCISLTALVGAITTPLAAYGLSPYIRSPTTVFIIDFAMLVVFLRVVMRTDRFWPIWIAAFQLNTVMTFIEWSLVRIAPESLFDASAGFWSLPLLIVLGIGPMLDRRAQRRGMLNELHNRSGHRSN